MAAEAAGETRDGAAEATRDEAEATAAGAAEAVERFRTGSSPPPVAAAEAAEAIAVNFQVVRVTKHRRRRRGSQFLDKAPAVEDRSTSTSCQARVAFIVSLCNAIGLHPNASPFRVVSFDVLNIPAVSSRFRGKKNARPLLETEKATTPPEPTRHARLATLLARVRSTRVSAPPRVTSTPHATRMSTHAKHQPSFEEMTFTEPRTVLFAVGEKESIETKLCWRWARDHFIVPSDQIWLVHTRKKQSGWIPLDSVKTLSDVSLAKDWLPGEIAQSIHGMTHKLIVIDTTHDPGEALLKFLSLETPRDALLVMGSRGRTGWTKYMLGSVSSYVAQYAPIPLLVVRSRKYRDIPDLTSDSVGAAYLGMSNPGASRTVAVAVDGTESSVAIVKWACLNAFRTSDNIHVLHSAVDETPIQFADVTKRVKTCMDVLGEFQKDDAAGTATSVLLDIKGGDVRDLIVDYVAELGGAVDLLVMGTRGIKGNLKRAVMGSVSSYALSFANCPVLVVPADVAREAAGPEDDDETPAA